MDQQSFELLRRVVESQLARIRTVIEARSEEERGGAYVRFVHKHLDALETLESSTAEEFSNAATDKERTLLGGKLYRLKLWLDEVHGNVHQYHLDIGRQDLPVGLLHLIDALIEQLLKVSADPIIHLDGLNMYSTQRLVDQWKRLSNHLGIVWEEPVEPIIFNLPGLDPSNAHLAPILAHEVGHAVVQHNDLIGAVESRLAENEVNQLKATFAEAAPGDDIDDALQQFARWVGELLCDALATELMGPSLLFSAAVFLPASAAGSSGPDHPDPAQRIALTLRQLEDRGWTAPLESRCPAVMAWLGNVAATQPTATEPHEEFLRGLVELAGPHIIQIAHEYVDITNDWTSFEGVESEVMQFLVHGIPPAVVQGESVSPWQAITAYWLHGISVHSDTPEGVAKVAEDRSLSRFSLKSIEMARVMKLWQEGV